SYPSLSGSGTLVLIDSGDMIGTDPMGVASRWLTDGGQFEIEAMALTSGDVTAHIVGQAVLEIDGTLTGDLHVRYAGERDLPLLIAALFPSLADDAATIA